MLEKNFKYYIDHQEELVEKYKGKILVIVKQSVAGIFSSKTQAYLDSVTKFKPGEFLIIECLPGNQSYTITQRSRVIATV